MRKRNRVLPHRLLGAAYLGVTAALLPLSLQALAPVEGAHYAARPSDTGFQGTVNSSGGFNAAVPLDLPGARGNLPVPLQVVYGGSSVGAAGLGWDVPLSFIAVADTTAKRRPAPQAFSVDQPPPLLAPERLVLTLNGLRTELIRNAADTAWIARAGNSQIEVRSDGEGQLLAYDGLGRTYRFSSAGAAPGSRLAGGKLYLLRSISGAGSNTLQLDYDLGAPALAGGGNGLAINLASVSYNAHPTAAGCFKHKIVLGYDAPVVLPAAPLALSMFDATVLARVKKLTDITVKSRETCASTEKTLSKYTFTYIPDTDLQQPRLLSVKRSGQQGTPEQNVSLPVATYSYGALDTVIYDKTQIASPPMLIGGSRYSYGISYTTTTTPKDPISPILVVSRRQTSQMLMDFTGDGRPDFLGQGLFENRAGAQSVHFVASASTIPFEGPVQRTSKYSGSRGGGSGGSGMRTDNVSDTLSQFIDMNGDGRIDFVDAESDANNWIVHLNTPHPSDPEKFVFVARKIPTANLRLALAATGRVFKTAAGNPPADAAIPLARVSSVDESDYATCWRLFNTQGQPPERPDWRRVPDTGCANFPAHTERKRTVAEFELRDVNGDGYPDFVYNASPAMVLEYGLSPPDAPYPDDRSNDRLLWKYPNDMIGSRDVKVLINTAGVHLAETERVFSSPLTLEAGAPGSCGLSQWLIDPGSASGAIVNKICGFEDVNGDGILDRVVTTAGVTTARLGSGDMSRPFAGGATITLPGPLSRAESHMVPKPGVPGEFIPSSCATAPTNPDTKFATAITRALRDINGDHIPDYIRSPSYANSALLESFEPADPWYVSFGTGTGFTAEKLIAVAGGEPKLGLSWERGPCTGIISGPNIVTFGGTPSGLYDIDGNGQPEFVVMRQQSWDVYQLRAGTQVDVGGGIAGRPDAGRLVRIDNGYGASTTIGYRSAKEEWNSAHRVPFPEIVVESVGTKNTANGSLLSTLRYAYRGAEMIFDPVGDAFRFAGYRRTVNLAAANGNGTATITDTYGLEPFTPGMAAVARFGRYLKAGLVREVTTLALSGANHDNPWDVLNIDTAKDARRLSGASYSWETRLLPAGQVPAANERCLDMVYPYDLVASRNAALASNEDACTRHGFVYQASAFGWRGTPGTSDALSSTQVVQTHAQVTAVDDFERVTAVRRDNDLNIADDDQCIEAVYAAPAGSGARVLNALSQRVVKECDSDIVVAQSLFEYDTDANGVKLPAGQVSKGFLTGQVASRLHITGEPVDPAQPELRSFDAAYDPATGNVVKVSGVRDDGASLELITSYDPFGLVATGTQTKATAADGSALPTLASTTTVDALTLLSLSTTDANGSKSGLTYDGFGRPLLATVTPAGGSEGALAKISYAGFAVGQGGGRSITRKTFTDPVPLSGADSATGRSSTVFLDSLGRTDRSELALGADYAGQKLVAGQRSYDLFGQVDFMADPFLSGQSFASAYGTTYHFRNDGTPQCTYRGYGRQLYEADPMTLEASERYVTCTSHRFANRQEIVESSAADARLAGSPQQGVVDEVTYDAVGRVLGRLTRQNGNAVLERMAMGYDLLGRLVAVERYKDAAGAKDPVAIQWQYDSLGRLLRFDEAATASLYHRYDNWGQRVATEWCDTTVSACTAPASFNRGQYSEYDALGRLRHSEERSSGVAVPETLRDFSYDVGVANTTPPVTPTYLLGRLAKASSPTSSVAYSYDGYGRAQTEIHTDLTQAPGPVFVQKSDYYGNGALKALHLQLPDNAYADEKADYTYDSAGRLRTVKFSDGVVSKDLFDAAGSSAIDVFGRIRQAKYGANTLTANYADTGLRLLNSVKVAAPAPLTTTREIVYTGTNGSLPAVDPLGRERSRKEIRDGNSNVPVLRSAYDALGRLQDARRQFDGQAPEETQSFTYDALGNLVLSGAGTPASLILRSYQSQDRDRLCSMGFAGTAPNPVCNVKYDGTGAIVEMPTRNGGTRTLSYFPGGATRSIAQGGTLATYDYDAFGAVQRLRVSSPSAADIRNDKHFGAHISQRDEVVNGTRSAVLTRDYPGPGGLLATRHGAGSTSPWTFAFGDGRGNRFYTDHTGAFVQDVEYQPYGEVRTASGALPGSPLYSSEQWNGGDALAALGVSQLGARLYDPVLGRFLSRDPLIIPRTGATTNPYAFAMNDPVNKSDPTGMDPESGDPYGVPDPWQQPGGGGGGGGGGGSAPDVNDSFPAGTHGGGSGEKFSVPGKVVDALHTTAGGIYVGLHVMTNPQGYFTNEGMYQIHKLHYCANDKTWCDPEPADESLLATVKDSYFTAFTSMGFSGVLVPKYYIRHPTTVEMQQARNGVEYFDARDRYMAARATIAMTRFNERATMLAGSVMELSGAVMDVGALGVGKVNCFVAGTKVATASGAVPIETLRLGDRVEAGNADCANRHFPANALAISLEMVDPQDPGKVFSVELVRTREWLDSNRQDDGHVYLELEELGIAGPARLLQVRPAPPEQPGEGCLVLMTVRHVADELLKLRLETGTEIEVTPLHPFLVEGHGWLPAGDLVAGQRLYGETGLVRVESVVPAPAGREVFNIEVDVQHVYRVSDDHILVHNQSPFIFRSATRGNLKHLERRPKDKGRLSFQDNQNPGGQIRNGDNYVAVDARKLPPTAIVIHDGGEVVDGVLMPPGHVSVLNATPAEVDAAVIGTAKLGKGKIDIPDE